MSLCEFWYFFLIFDRSLACPPTDRTVLGRSGWFLLKQGVKKRRYLILRGGGGGSGGGSIMIFLLLFLRIDV